MRLPHLPFVFAAILLQLSSAAAAPERPNIVFILADDLGYGELGSYGQTKIRTPHLDRLAAEGMRFTQFYAGSTVCAPSRSVLMTGQHMGHTTVRGNAGAGNLAAQTLRPGEPTLARVLQKTGYTTALVGKWGLGETGTSGDPNRQGFDYFFGYTNQTHAHNHYPNFLFRNGQRVKLPNDLVPVGEVEGVGYATKRLVYEGDVFAREARQFVDAHRERPFFLFLSLVSPHANNERARELGDGHEVPDQGQYALEPWNDSTRNHAQMITRMDRDIGELMAHLKNIGLDERTLVIFTSDNGPHQEGGPDYDPAFFDVNGPFSGLKRDLTEGGIRVPFIARWPGRIPAGVVSAQVGYFGDMMATFADLAGALLPPDRDSISLVPTLLGRGTQPQHEFLYWEFYESGVSQAVLLEGRWKGIRLKSPDAPLQLFDLAADPAETKDVAAAHADVAQRIAAIMHDAHVPNEHWRLNAAR
ncbi:MAG TPA: arylsulfatase [Opitutus sp.]|nr:arylsulfatase [Opitutus sp.]